MDIILNILLALIVLLLNYSYFMKTTLYKKFKRVVYAILFIFVILLIYINLDRKKEKFQSSNNRRSKISRLKMECGLPDNYNPTSHCFADSTHQTCCLLGPKARKYSMESGNEIGNLSVEASKKFREQTGKPKNEDDTTPWCTCLGSRVCSYYADKFNDGTRVLFVNDVNHPKNIVKVSDSKCEGKVGDFLNTRRHGTPGVLDVRDTKCDKDIKNMISQI